MTVHCKATNLVQLKFSSNCLPISIPLDSWEGTVGFYVQRPLPKAELALIYCFEPPTADVFIGQTAPQISLEVFDFMTCHRDTGTN
jgi:hypothetical protein